MKIEGDLAHILEHTTAVWEQIRGKTIFVTGGTGFFGKWLLESFLYADNKLSLDARMIVLSRNPEKFLAKNPNYITAHIAFVAGDVSDFIFPVDDIDYIIHAATEASVSLNIEQPLLMFDTIVNGTRHVLDLARIKRVRSILHTSSGAVYGKQPSEMTHIPEHFSGAPDIYEESPSYSEGKRVAEMLSNIYYNSFGVNSKIARCFAFVGPFLPLDTHFAIGNFIRNVINGEKIVIKGDGSPFRSYLYASDLTIWLWNILIFGENCRPYNVGSDQDITIAQLAAEVVACTNNNIKIEILLPESDIPVARYVPEVRRAREELNLNIDVSLRDGIKKTIDFYSKY